MPHSPTDDTAIPGAAITGTGSRDDARGPVALREMAERLGVVRHLTETYSVGGYRYTNLADAIAQARSMAKLERELL